MTFGARVFKTGVAVTLAMYASILLGWQPAVIAAVAAVFAMQPSIYRSWRYFWEQIQTNTLGAALAMLALFFFKNDPIAVGLVCILVIMICLKLNMGETLGLTLVTVIVVMEAPGGGWQFALNRFLLSVVGIASASLVNVLLIPPNPKKQFFGTVRGVFDRLSLLLRTVISDEMKENVFREEKDKLDSEIGALSDKYKLFEEEQKKLKRPRFRRIRRLVVYRQMLNALVKGKEILETVENHYFPAHRPQGTDSRFDDHLEKLIKYHEHILLKFENKIKPEAFDDHGIDEENDAFMARYICLQAEGKTPNPRLALVVASMYEYGYELARLDRLVEQFNREPDADLEEASSTNPEETGGRWSRFLSARSAEEERIREKER